MESNLPVKRTLTVYYSYPHNLSKKPVPFIRLSGCWLKQCGFSIGDKIQIEQQQGGLLLIRCLPKPLEPEPTKQKSPRRCK